MTLTINTLLDKPATGDSDWGVRINTDLDNIDKFVGQTCVGNPNTGGVPILFEGQRIFQGRCCAWWVGYKPSGLALVWVREIPRGVAMPWSGSVTVMPAGWVLADGATLVMDGETFTVMDLRGRFVIGHDPSNIEHNVSPNPITTPKIGGAASRVVNVANIEQFSIGQSSMRYGTGTTTGVDVSGVGGVDVDSGSSNTNLTVGTVGAVGIDIRPPYYTAAWICKL